MTTTLLSDEELGTLAKNGDMTALGELVTRHKEAITRTVASILGRGADADDAVQEVFIKFYHNLHRFRGDAAPATYLKRIAINQSLDTLRRRKRMRHYFTRMDHAAAATPHESSFEDFDRAHIVRQAVQALKPHHRAVVILRLLEGHSTRETAKILRIPVGTVLSRLSRASQALRPMLRHLTQDDA